MSTAYSSGCAGGAPSGVASWLQLAATPCFATMALLTQVMGDDQSVLICSATSGASPLTGMTAMYWLMAIFHAVPWLKLIFNRRRQIPSPLVGEACEAGCIAQRGRGGYSFFSLPRKRG